MSDLKEKRVELILAQLEELPTLPAVALFRIAAVTLSSTMVGGFWVDRDCPHAALAAEQEVCDFQVPEPGHQHLEGREFADYRVRVGILLVVEEPRQRDRAVQDLPRKLAHRSNRGESEGSNGRADKAAADQHAARCMKSPCLSVIWPVWV